MMPRDLYIVCDVCRRGLIHGPEWSRPCPVCKGRGSMSLATLCELIGEWESTVRKLFRTNKKMRAKVAARICDKIVNLTTYGAPNPPPKQPELFS